MGSATSTPLPRDAVPEGMTRICVSGWSISTHTGRAAEIARKIAEIHPQKYETWFYFSLQGFRWDFLNGVKAELSEEEQKEFAYHKTSPYCWLETPDGKRHGIGGRDKLCDWALKTFKEEKDEPFLSRCHDEPGFKEAIFDNAPNGTAQTRG